MKGLELSRAFWEDAVRPAIRLTFEGMIDPKDYLREGEDGYSLASRRLTEAMRRQARHFGREFLLAEAQGIDVDGDFRIVRTSRGAFRCFAVLLATGAHPRKVGFEGEETFRGRGVACCAVVALPISLC